MQRMEFMMMGCRRYIFSAALVLMVTACLYTAQSPPPADAQSDGGQPTTGQEAQTIGPIQHETESDVPPRSRLNIGINELLDCWIDTSTWNGPPGDSLGDIRWSVSGEGTLSENSGPSTTYMADCPDAPVTIQITATITDSQGWVPAIHEQIVVPVAVPTDITRAWNHDTSLGWPGNNTMGADSIFDTWVAPNVDFSRTNFREQQPACKINWPDGTVGNVAAAPPVQYNVTPDPAGLKNNHSFDESMFGQPPIAKLKGQPFSFQWNVPQEYQLPGPAGAWKQFCPEVHWFSFKGNGQCCTTEVPNNASGNWEGPWQ